MDRIDLRFSRPDVDIKKDFDGRWRAPRIYGKAGGQVKWKCPNCNIYISFPGKRTPLLGGVTEASGRSSLGADIDPKASGYYMYSALVQDKDDDVQVVEGNSPPDMVIE